MELDPSVRRADGDTPTAPAVVVLAGGTGGAKLARGMLDVVSPERVTVVANTGDDLEIYGAHVSPDPDLVAFWLADRIGERGWGLEGDTFAVMDALREIGIEVWFNLGDRDLAWCIERTRMLSEGTTLTAATRALTASLPTGAQVLPMCDESVRTWVATDDGWTSFQEFMIRRRAADPVRGFEFRGVERARVTPQVTAALAQAQAVIVGPSNPLVSIDPILAVPGMADALSATRAPIVAVSPIVQGRVIKGPTAAFMEWAGHPLSADGVAEHYGALVDGMVADEPVSSRPALRVDTRMDSAEGRRRVAESTLGFALDLAARG